MRISLLLLITAPVVAVVIILSAIAFLDVKSTANNLMEQNLAQIQDHIEERLDDLLNLPDRILKLNTNLIRDGQAKSIGVMNAELTLDDLTLYLENLSIGQTGKAF